VPNQRGAEAVRLAATLAASDAADLDITVALPVERITFDRYSPDHAYFDELEGEGREWLDDAMREVPDGSHAAGKIVHGETITEGLIEAATDPGWGPEAALIVIGTSHRGLAGRFTIGSIASALLHSSPVPVALAPAGYQGHPSITRITCATGTREGADALLDVAIDTAARRQLPLRLMSLVALDARGSDDENAAHAETVERHTARLAEKATAALPPECPVTTVIGQGASLEECVEALDFSPSEIVLVGSSRLAGPRKMFIGASANKMLRALPVPMIVVPRDYEPPPELNRRGS
jgi:nucleotide-binding universal stress UspA family protein